MIVEHISNRIDHLKQSDSGRVRLSRRHAGQTDRSLTNALPPPILMLVIVVRFLGHG